LLQKAVEELYCQVNSNNAIVKGFTAKGPEEAKRKIRSAFYEVGAPEPQIHSIRPIGPFKYSVKFESVEDKNNLFKNARKLGQIGFQFEDDLPPTLRVVRNILLKRRRDLIDHGGATNVKVFKQSLLVDGEDFYDYNRSTHSMEKRSKRGEM
jgi:hypothetical protein